MNYTVSELLLETVKRFEGKKNEYEIKNGLQSAAKEVNALGLCQTQGQFDALTEFVYNLGLKELNTSELLNKIRSHAPAKQIQAEFKKHNRKGGRIVPAMTFRRRWDAQTWVLDTIE